MKKISLWFLINLVAFSYHAHAQEKSPWAHESEASVVIVNGNSESESYSAKQKTSYKFDSNVLIATGRYLQSKSGSTETAKQWEAALRYERELSDRWSVFIQHGAESDTFAKYLQRDNTDLGGKYFFIKSDVRNFFLEAGVRSSKTIASPIHTVIYFNSGRFYAEYTDKINESVSGKFWAEYLPDFKSSGGYLLNYEPSINVMMSQVFSIKVAYLVKYHSKVKTSDEKKEDRSFTTALVAKF